MGPETNARREALWQWWPLAALMVLAAVLRLSTLDLQSFWYDEAYVPVHTLHPSLVATLRSVEYRENTPPLWYVLIWAWSRIFGTGMLALRLPSALAGIATVPVAWGIGQQLAGRRQRGTRRSARLRRLRARAQPAVRVVLAGGTRLRPVRVHGGARDVVLAARRRRCPRRAGWRRSRRAARRRWRRTTSRCSCWRRCACGCCVRGARRCPRSAVDVAGDSPPCRPALAAVEGAFAAVAAIVLVGAALIPLALAQGGHGTQWIGAWALASRLEAIPQYYLTGYSGAPLGHGLELLVALEILAAVGYGLWRVLDPARERIARCWRWGWRRAGC